MDHMDMYSNNGSQLGVIFTDIEQAKAYCKNVIASLLSFEDLDNFNKYPPQITEHTLECAGHTYTVWVVASADPDLARQ